MEEPGKLKLVADVATISEGGVLLVRYKDTKRYDGQKGWFIPDDYLRRLEHPEDGALRILKEQLGLELPRVDLGFIESFEGNGAWHLIFHFAARPAKRPKLAPSPNTSAAEWFDLVKLPVRGEVAHSGWALDILGALGKPRDEAIHVRTVVE